MGKRILVVEDSTTVANMVRFTLRKSGIECDVAANGIEGLKLIRTTSPRYNFVLVDLNMPKMDGMEMLRLVRSCCEPYREIPFVFLTTTTEQSVKDEARAHGVKAWMTKPFAPEKLLEMVDRFATP